MKYLPLIALLIATPVHAKDITITLNDQEQKAFITLLDVALKAGGLASLDSVTQLIQKLKAAINAKPEEAPKK